MRNIIMLEEERRKRLQKIVVPPFEDDSRLDPWDFIYGKHYLRGSVGCTIANSGVGKSSLALLDAVVMVSCRALLGIEPAKPQRVLVWNGEESWQTMHKRTHAICRHHTIDYRLLNGRLFLLSGLDWPIKMKPEDPKQLGWVEEFIEGYAIDVVILDPLVAMHSVPEKENQQIDALVRQWLSVANKYKIAVDIHHHTRKPPSGSTIDMTTEDARGATALRAACRSARALNQLSAEEAKGWQVKPSERKGHVRIDDGDKMNYAESGGETWFRIVNQRLGNGDDCGLVVPWKPPGAFEGVAMSQVEEIWRNVGQGLWRASAQAKKWVGHLVADICQLDVTAQRSKIQRMIKTWIDSGTLVVVEHDDEQRRPRAFVDAGPNNPNRSTAPE